MLARKESTMTALPACLLALALLPAEGDTTLLESRSFLFPVAVDPDEKASISHIALFVSRDRGNTGKEPSRIAPDKDSVTYHAPGDGLYWFTLQVVSKDGSRNPTDVARAPVGQKVV